MARYIAALGRNKGLHDAIAYAEQWRDTPQVALALKTAVEAGTGASGNWAEQLGGVYQTMAAEWAELLRPLSILGRIPNVAMAPFRTRVQRVATGVSASWIGADNPIPASAMAFAEPLLLEPLKLETIVCITKELADLSQPAAELMIRKDALNAIAQYADQQFIDPTVSASAGVRPASITYGATSRSSTGSTIAAITADVAAMFASAITGGCTLQSAVWVLHPRSAAFLWDSFQPATCSPFAGRCAGGDSWFGLPVITSASVPIDTGLDTYAVLIDGGEILVADGGLEIDVSGNASIQLSTAPSDAASQQTSLFQENLIGIRAIRFLNYTRRRDAAVQVLEDVSW